MKRFILFVLIASIFLVGCGTIYNNMPRSVHIVSSPSDANYKIYDRTGNYVNRVNSIVSKIEMTGTNSTDYSSSLYQNNLTTPDLVEWSTVRFSHITFEKTGYTSKTVKMSKTRANHIFFVEAFCCMTGAILHGHGKSAKESLREQHNIPISEYTNRISSANSYIVTGGVIMIAGGICTLIDLILGNTKTYPDYVAVKLTKSSQTTSTDGMHSDE